MSDKTRAAIVGLFVICAFAVIGMILLFLKPSFGDGELQFRLRFVNIEKIGVGTRVTLAGKPIGQVTAIHPVSDARQATGPSEMGSNVYSYELELEVDSHTPIYYSDLFISQTSGLLGEKSVAIIPQRVKGPLQQVKAGELIYAHMAPSVEDAMDRFSRITVKAEETLNTLGEIVSENKTGIHTCVDNLAESSVLFKDLLESCKRENLGENLAQASKETAICMKDLQTITSQVSQGKGSIGRLLMKDDLYLDINQTIARVNILMSDINNYGLLFHSNRTWKQQRSYQMEKLMALRQPEAFEKFWKDQLYSVQTQMGYLAEMMVQAKLQAKENQSLIDEPKFEEAVKSALKQLGDLQQQLTLFEASLHNNHSPISVSGASSK